MQSPLISFRAVPPVGDALTGRTRGADPAPSDLSETARRDLARYHTMLGIELATAATQLDPGEALALCELLNSTFVGDSPTDLGLLVRTLPHEVASADAELATKWDCDLATLADLVAGWTPFQRLAVIDAVERWWRLDDAEKSSERESTLRAVGLLPTDGAHPTPRP